MIWHLLHIWGFTEKNAESSNARVFKIWFLSIFLKFTKLQIFERHRLCYFQLTNVKNLHYLCDKQGYCNRAIDFFSCIWLCSQDSSPGLIRLLFLLCFQFQSTIWLIWRRSNNCLKWQKLVVWIQPGPVFCKVIFLLFRTHFRLVFVVGLILEAFCFLFFSFFPSYCNTDFWDEKNRETDSSLDLFLCNFCKLKVFGSFSYYSFCLCLPY